MADHTVGARVEGFAGETGDRAPHPHVRVLLIEDSPDDAELVCRALGRQGYRVTHRRVDDEESLTRSLDEATWDAILCDYNVPGLSHLVALGQLEERGLDTPFLIVSGAIGEETAVEAMRAGAHDYVRKDNLSRLAPALEREVAAAAARARQRDDAEMFQALLASAPDAVVAADDRGVICTWNRAARDIFGYTSGEAIGRPIAMLFGDRERPDDGRGCPTSPGRGQTLERVGVRRDGSEFPAACSRARWCADGQTYTGWLIRDVSERKRIEAELAEAQKLESCGRLAAGIAHEINTPIQYVGDNLRFLGLAFERLLHVLDAYEAALPTAADDARQHALEVARRARLAQLRSRVPGALSASVGGIDTVSEIVRSMRSFSHQATTAKTPFDLNEAVAETLAVSRHEWKYVAEVETLLDPELPLVPCVGREINQVLLNCIVNAAHALEGRVKDTGQRGTITLATRDCGDAVELSIADTGCGISEDVRARIFEPFFTTKSRERGTGQGLAIAHTIVVDHHGGALWCDSQPGRGTTFHIRLPL